jgi:asparagine N-glycosylation enzyme membrane subunit Stt3
MNMFILTWATFVMLVLLAAMGFPGMSESTFNKIIEGLIVSFFLFLALWIFRVRR